MANPYQGDDVDYFEAARDEEGNVKQTGLAPTAKLSTFGAAFNAARKAGDKTFMFKGKKYTTEMAKPKAAAAKPAAAASKPAAAASKPAAAASKPAVAASKPAAASAPAASRTDTSSKTRGLTPSLLGSEMGEDATEKEPASKRIKSYDSDEDLGQMSDVIGAKRGGQIKSKKPAKKYAGGGSVNSASRRADGCAVRGKTKGRMV